MAYSSEKFIFIDKLDNIPIPESSFVVDIRNKITDQDELYEVYKKTVTFPDYFGENWNAFWDLMASLHWISQKNLIIRHYTSPFLIDNELKIYLEILHDTIAHWEKYDEHKVFVYFPTEFRKKIKELFGS